MNRAILIVICDFLVSAMLSMMTGMVPAHTGGTGVGLDENTTRTLLEELNTHRRELEQLRLKLREAVQKFGSTPEREAELRRLAEEIAANMDRQEKIRAAAESRPETTGKLSPEELQRRLDAERRKRLAAEVELKDHRTDLARAREMLKKTDQLLSGTRKDLDRSQASLRETSGALVELSREHVKTQRALAESDAQLKTRTGQLRARESDLAGARDALREINARLGQVKEERQTLQTTLAFQTGKLNTTEQELASLQGELKRTKKDLATRELERTEARRQRDEMAGVVKRVVADLSAARGELEKTRKELDRSTREAAVKEARLSEKLTSANELLRHGNLRSDALSRYSEAALRLTVRYAEKRMFETLAGGGTYYLPVVDFDGVPLLVGGIRKLAGNGEKEMGFRKVVELAYNAGDPAKPGSLDHALSGPLLISPGDPRAAALPVPGLRGRKALKLLSWEKLRERGVKNLYLFKSTSFGRESAELTGRCSIDLAGQSPYLFITNAGRGTGADLRAEPGDLVLSQEGDFVGIVVEDNTRNFGRVRQAKALLFPAKGAWLRAEKISLRRQQNEPFFTEYGERIQAVMARIDGLSAAAR